VDEREEGELAVEDVDDASNLNVVGLREVSNGFGLRQCRVTGMDTAIHMGHTKNLCVG
jgi:hypothetical protein